MFLRALMAALVALTLSAGEADARKGKRIPPVAAPQSQTIKSAAKDEGPDLPYSCATIRFHAWMRGFKYPLTPEMKAKIAALEKAKGITPKQHRQAEKCFDKEKK